eukprot:3103909-Rhodomonas_salina.1
MSGALPVAPGSGIASISTGHRDDTHVSTGDRVGEAEGSRGQLRASISTSLAVDLSVCSPDSSDTRTQYWTSHSTLVA